MGRILCVSNTPKVEIVAFGVEKQGEKIQIA